MTPTDWYPLTEAICWLTALTEHRGNRIPWYDASFHRQAWPDTHTGFDWHPNTRHFILWTQPFPGADLTTLAQGRLT